MQAEYKGLRRGVCLAISLEDVESLYKRTHNNQEANKRAQLQRSQSRSGSDEREQQYFCLCDCERPNLWRTSSSSSSSSCPVPALDSCTHRICTGTNELGSSWTDGLNTADKNMNCNTNEQTVILYNDNILTQLFAGRDSTEITEQCNNNNTQDVFKNIGADKVNISNKDHNERRSVINKEQSDDQRTWKTTDERRKSVSFADDVIVYLYDEDSPTEKWHHEFSSRPTTEILFDDNELQWDDDFLALEKNCPSHTEPKTPSAQNWTVNKCKSLVLSQSCLFLTHVNESDLEL